MTKGHTWLVVNLCPCTLSLSLEKKLRDKRGARGKWWRGGLMVGCPPNAGGQSSQQAVGAGSCRCPATRLSLTASNVGTFKGTHHSRHGCGSRGERCRVAGARRAAQHQRGGHQPYAGDGAHGTELHGFRNRDEMSLKSAVLRMWWKN